MSERLSSKPLLSGGLLPLLILAGVLLLSGVVKKLFFSNSSSFEIGIPPEATAPREPAGATLDQELYHESPPDATSRRTLASEPLTAPRPLAGHPEMERLRLMTVQIRLLREYAALHGPDDPFSLTEKEIEDFRLKGNPYIE